MYFDLRNQGLQIYSCKGVAFHIKQKSYGQSSQSAAAVEKGFKFLCAIILPTPEPTLCWAALLHRLWSCTTHMQILGLTFLSCVTLGKL